MLDADVPKQDKGAGTSTTRMPRAVGVCVSMLSPYASAPLDGAACDVCAVTGTAGRDDPGGTCGSGGPPPLPPPDTRFFTTVCSPRFLIIDQVVMVTIIVMSLVDVVFGNVMVVLRARPPVSPVLHLLVSISPPCSYRED